MMSDQIDASQNFCYRCEDDACTLQSVDNEIIAKKAFLWLAIQSPDENTKNVVKQIIPDSIFQNLFMDDTRPRRIIHKEGCLFSLRGINVNPGESPDDMVSLCLWVTPDFIITVNPSQAQATKDLHAELSQHQPSINSVDCLTRLISFMFSYIEDEIYQLDEQFDQAERIIDQKKLDDAQTLLVELRQKVINFRRYLMPEREALNHISSENLDWVGRKNLLKLKEFSQDIIRYTDDLNAARDRAIVLQDNLTNRFSERLNQKMYALSVVALIFMPTALITSLLGINVHIPGSDYKFAFWFICIILLGIMGCLFFILKKKKWI